MRICFLCFDFSFVRQMVHCGLFRLDFNFHSFLSGKWLCAKLSSCHIGKCTRFTSNLFSFSIFYTVFWCCCPVNRQHSINVFYFSTSRHERVCHPIKRFLFSSGAPSVSVGCASNRPSSSTSSIIRPLVLFLCFFCFMLFLVIPIRFRFPSICIWRTT